MRTTDFFRVTALAALAATAAVGQDRREDPISWSLRADEAARPLKSGGEARVHLAARIEEGWHLYSTEQPPNGPKPTRITLPAGQPFELAGEIEAPAPRAARDENFGVETEFYEGSVTFTLPVRLAAGAPPGEHKLEVHVRYQTCNQELCLPPKTAKLELALTAQ